MALRQRVSNENTSKQSSSGEKASHGAPSSTESVPFVKAAIDADSCKPRKSRSPRPTVAAPTFLIAKWTILRLMGCMYLTVFAAAWIQNIGLMGEHGLLPATDFMSRLEASLNGGDGSTTTTTPWQRFVQYPSLFWYISLSDVSMKIVHAAGMIISLIVVVGRVNSWLIQLVLWLLYFTVVTTAGGTSFYQYGWESQILETGMLCVFLCTLPQLDVQKARVRLALWERNTPQVNDTSPSRLYQYTTEHPPTAVTLWLFQWLIFRISTGAGLIKIRGSSCWTKKTCLYYHFETQPIPSPLSFLYHFAPRFIQRRMIDVDLLVQLYTAWMVLIPAVSMSAILPRLLDRVLRWIARTGGFLQVSFMIGILLSGNFSVLNHLTIIPALACLDDSCWPHFMRIAQEPPNRGSKLVVTRTGPVPWTRRCIDVMILLLILYLSRPVIDNLLQRGGHRQQLMNASFDSFRLVNTYGAFGSVGEARYEAIVQISDDGEQWTEIEFPCKPGNVYRTPCFCAPYHYRLDWNIWFLGFKPHQSYLRSRESWLYSLLYKILEVSDDKASQPRPWLALLDSSSQELLLSTYYREKRAPKFVKVDMYHYQMAEPLWTILRRKLASSRLAINQPVAWWTRTFEETLIPPVTLSSFR